MQCIPHKFWFARSILPSHHVSLFLALSVVYNPIGISPHYRILFPCALSVVQWLGPGLSIFTFSSADVFLRFLSCYLHHCCVRLGWRKFFPFSPLTFILLIPAIKYYPLPLRPLVMIKSASCNTPYCVRTQFSLSLLHLFYLPYSPSLVFQRPVLLSFSCLLNCMELGFAMPYIPLFRMIFMLVSLVVYLFAMCKYVSTSTR